MHFIHFTPSNQTTLWGFNQTRFAWISREVQTYHSLLVVKHTARGNLCSLKGSIAFSSWFALLMYSSAIMITIALCTFRVAFGFLVPPQPPATYQTRQYSITIHTYVLCHDSIQLSSWEQCSCVQEQFFGGIFLWATLWGALSFALVCLYRDPQVRTYPWVTPSLDSLDLYYQEDHTLSSFAVGAAFRGFRDCYKETGLKL